MGTKMSLPECGFTREELNHHKCLDERGCCTADWADGSKKTCGWPLAAHPHQAPQQQLQQLASQPQGVATTTLMVHRSPDEQLNEELRRVGLLDQLKKKSIRDRESLGQDNPIVSKDGAKKSINLQMDPCGRFFKFVNRDTECISIINGLVAQECMINSTYEHAKSSYHIVATMGLSGSGKTTISRKALSKTLTMNRGVITNGHLKRCLLHEVLMIRINCKDCSDIMGQIEPVHIAKLIFYSAFRYMMDVSKCHSFVQLIFSKDICIHSIFHFIFGWEKDIKAVILHVDEIDAFVDNPAILRSLFKGVTDACTQGKHVYLTVSGLYRFQLLKKATVDVSRLSDLIQIRLPPLNVKYFLEILADFLGQGKVLADELKPSPYLQLLLWSLGGMPRMLEFLVQEAAKHFQIEYSRMGLLKRLCNICADDYISVVTKVSNRISLKQESIQKARGFVESIVSLLISGIKGIKDSVVLTNGECTVTIEDLQYAEVIQLKQDGSAFLPPLYLKSLLDTCSIHSGIRSTPTVYIRGLLDLTLTPRDNETLFPEVIYHRLRAKRILHHDFCDLKYLIPGITNVEGIAKKYKGMMVEVPPMNDITFGKPAHTISGKNIQFDNLSFTCNINVERAAAADAYIRLLLRNANGEVIKLIIAIQEKSSRNNKANHLFKTMRYLNEDDKETKVADDGEHGVPWNKVSVNVQEEEDKALPTMDQREPNVDYLFIILADGNFNEPETNSEERYCIRPEKFDSVLGEFVSTMRKYCIKSSSMDGGIEIDAMENPMSSIDPTPTFKKIAKASERAKKQKRDITDNGEDSGQGSRTLEANGKKPRNFKKTKGSTIKGNDETITMMSNRRKK